MPNMDGAGLARSIQADARCGHPALILATSVPSQRSAEQLLQLGFAGYLVKPIKRGVLFDVLASVAQQPPVIHPAQPREPLIGQDARVTSPPRVLLAEDNPVNCKVAARMLEKIGCRCDIAEDGEQALQAVQLRAYDLVLMDCMMPVMDGFAATQAIRALGPPFDQLPIYALTASVMEEDQQRCYAAGMSGFLAKPVQLQELREALSEAMEQPTPRWRIEA